MRHFLGLTIGSIALSVTLAACGGGTTDADTKAAVSRVTGAFDSQAAAGQAITTQSAIVSAARAEAGKELGVAPDQINIDKVEPVQWSDTSLGCAEPGKVFAQTITPGFRIVLSAAGKSQEIHADAAGRLVTCAKPTQ